jgi:hypothetical protein
VRSSLGINRQLTNYSSYSTKNLLIPIILPGPHEQTAEQLQHYLKIIVDDLIKLFEDGIVICTPRFPQGKLSLIYTRVSTNLLQVDYSV